MPAGQETRRRSVLRIGGAGRIVAAKSEEAMLKVAKRVGVLGGLVACFVFGAGRGAWAEDPPLAAAVAFDEAVTAAELARHRAGEFDVISTIQNNQTLEAESSGNSITADQVTSGSVYVNGDALRDLRGIGQIVANSGPQSNLLGAISLNVILNPPPASP